ncbi:2',3'-cyclic-nucleotide 2'-phosphodiesterase / 3'-nucleotidase [Gemmobacter megaterium]|uniref:2',3'-cyclic-nucleotide 2'-phosphodiesterase / 3'-nucleotidase n=1 Tax=Gemmobacter megaterium TaxID=1086013 RepID=A0A1N7M1G6_9RHOB|nr:2',3'-cyclic-nucleotide 2'-phosphodiesterase / 3'-nucleotidase [Gemmobacter megaterium]
MSCQHDTDICFKLAPMESGLKTRLQHMDRKQILAPSRLPPPPSVTCEMTVFATSDLHLNLFPWDYYGDHAAPGAGLASVAAQIVALRESAPNSLLVDNGDFLQGTALGDALAAAHPTGHKPPHPMIETMNLLRYDAVGLGNHDFDYGLEFLAQALQGADFPVLCANLRRIDGGTLPFCEGVVLEREVQDRHGQRWPIRVGIAAFLPPQVMVWNHPHLHDRAEAAGIVETGRRVVQTLISAGAEVVIALCHSGFGTIEAGEDPQAEHAALALASLPGVDAVVAGHTHRLFPGPDLPAQSGVDPILGHLAGKPACKPGSGASHLGALRLTLNRGPDERWRCIGGRAEVLPLSRSSSDQIPAPFLHLCKSASAATRKHLDRIVGRTEVRLSTHFTLIGDCAATRLIAGAMQWHVAGAMQGGPYAHLPVLAATPPARSGGRGGVTNYTNLPAGPLRERDLAALYPYPNAIRALRVSGADLAAWLDHSARIFHQVAPGAQDAPLLDPDWPAYNFDVIEGLSYEIDLCARTGPGRVRNLRHNGSPVDPQASFILATSSYRAAGGGTFPATGPTADLVLSSDIPVRGIVATWLAKEGSYRPPPADLWRFGPCPGTSVVLETSPQALPHLPRAGLTPLDLTDNGFLRLRLSL